MNIFSIYCKKCTKKIEKDTEKVIEFKDGKYCEECGKERLQEIKTKRK